MRIGSLWSVQPEFRLKVSLLTLTFAFLTATQAIWRSLKVSIFAKTVGAAYMPDATISSIFLLIPLILFYSKLVDYLRRHQLVYVFTIFHGLGGLVFAYLLSDPHMGLANTVIDKGRWIGWAFFFFMESFSAFLSTTFWSFANSVNKPKDAKEHYGIFVTGSKLGGITAAGSMWLLLSLGMGRLGFISNFLFGGPLHISDSTLITTILAAGAISLLCAAVCIYFLMKYVPGYYMHGYEAAYQVEKKRERETKGFSPLRWIEQSVDGLKVILTNPYVLGIFSLSLFHDIIMKLFDLQVLEGADEANDTVGKLSLFYSVYFFTMHFVGFFISLFGTTPLQRRLGMRATLLVYPTLCLVLVALSFFSPSPDTLLVVVVILRAANYGLNHPIRETLYIPTTKEIKFKSKAWSDAFGTRIAKASSSLFFKKTHHFAPAIRQMMSEGFMLSIAGLWIAISYFLGRRLQKAIDNKEVIGAEKED
jgi:AAA family ATP:ADP antiporter